MVSMPTINMMDFGGGVTAGNCYAQPNETVIHIPSYEVHYKAPIQQQLSTCLVCKKTICLNAEATVDVYNSYTTNTKMIIAECLNRLVLASNTHAIPFNNPTICMNCYAQIDRLDALHNEFNLLKNCLREKMAEYIIKQIPEREESSPDPPQNVTMEIRMEEEVPDKTDIDKKEIKLLAPIQAPKRKFRYSHIEIWIPGSSLFPNVKQEEGEGYTCYFCYRKSKTKENLAAHFDIRHAPYGKIECRICSSDIKGGLDKFMVHVAQNHSLKHMRQAVGDFKVHSLRLLRITKNSPKDEHKVRKVHCRMCQQTMPEGALEDHVRECSEVGLSYKCDDCPQIFKTNKQYENHLRRWHPNSLSLNRYQCPSCDKRFFKLFNVRLHYQLVHENVRKYVCKICNFGFKMRCALTNHIRSKHTGLKPYVCVICEKPFSRLQECKKHVRNVHKVPITARFDPKDPKGIPIKIVGRLN